MNNQKREAGVLLHPVSLPSKYGIGDLGDEAYKFIDILKTSHVKLWQVLPLGPTGFGDSPYASRSTFAGNELLISPDRLFEDGYLDLEDILYISLDTQRIDYGLVRELKLPLLKKAAARFLQKAEDGYEKFKKDNAWWLDDYALYQVLCERYNDSRWFVSWPEELKKREKGAITRESEVNAEQIELYKVYQYFFFKQWGELKAYANENEVKIIGDIPIYVAPDSVDAWTGGHLLKLDENFNMETQSGVPPDAFSSTGQLWGNPTYRWSEHEKDGFSWWIKRLGEALKLCDIVRIDHFRGFSACWEVPATASTAAEGKWVKSPGDKLLKAFKKAFGGELPIIAEDLGVITEDVEELRDKNGLPGMKILQFAFGWKDGEFDPSNPYLPHNIGANCVVYTGTHDNNTTLGWYNSLNGGDKDYVRRYLETGDDDVVYKLIRAALVSNARYAVIPYQDVLALGEEARMNVPSTCGASNWSWKLKAEQLDPSLFARFAYYIKLYGRA